MNRWLAVLAVAVAPVSSDAVLGPSLARSADPVQKIAHVGFVTPESRSTLNRAEAAFWDRMRELGWVEGRNLIVEERWAEGHIDRLPALMAEVLPATSISL